MKIKKGWFYFIPIYYKPDSGELSGRNKVLDFILGGVLKIHLWCVGILGFICFAFGIEYEPSFPIRITGDKN